MQKVLRPNRSFTARVVKIKVVESSINKHLLCAPCHKKDGRRDDVGPVRCGRYIVCG